MNIKQAASFYYFNMISSEKLPEIAMNALLEGMESESLLLLASETDKIMSTVGPLFDQCLIELGLDTKSRIDHSIEASKYYAQQLISGDIRPDEFGFKVGKVTEYEFPPKILSDIYQNAQWHDECATEFGYPKDYKKTRAECEARITELAIQLCTPNKSVN